MSTYFLTLNRGKLDSGIATIMVLCTIVIIGLLYSLVALSISNNTQLQRDKIYGQNLGNKIWSSYAAQLTAGPESERCFSIADLPDLKRCILLSSTIFKSGPPAIRSIERGFPANQRPIWNRGIFETPTAHCLEILSLPPALKHSPLISIRSCSSLPSSISDKITLDGNLTVPGNTTTLNRQNLFVSGSILLAALKVTPPALVFSGGDIVISSLNIPPGTSEQLLLISAAGAIKVDTFTGPPVVSAIASRVQVPAAAESSTLSLDAPLLQDFMILEARDNPTK